VSTPEDSRNPDGWQEPRDAAQSPYSYGSQDGGHGAVGQGYGYQDPGYGQQQPYPPTDPYGQPGHGHDPYAQPGLYGQQGGYGPPYGPSQGYGQPPPQSSDRPHTHAIVALVVSIVLAMSCWVSLGGIAGAILSGIALSKVDTEPGRARALLRWCWIAIGINVVLLILGFAVFVIAGINGAFES
jgi:hypothetical protein